MNGEKNSYVFKPIAQVETPFREKFGVPRQPGLVKAARGVVRFLVPAEGKKMTEGLEGFSHVILLFVFHEHGMKIQKLKTRPPRLGGAQKIGVLASRTPHRPNPIGLSVVKLLGRKADGSLVVEGVDLLDGTPLLDIKPYLPYADAPKGAQAAEWARSRIEKQKVLITPAIRKKLKAAGAQYPEVNFVSLVREILALDPRPAFQQRKGKQGWFGTAVMDWDIHWTFDGDQIRILDVLDLDERRKALQISRRVKKT